MLKKCCCVSSKEYLLWGALIIAVIPVLLGGRGIVVGDTVTSRLATVFALAHEGTWYIDRPVDLAHNPF